MTRSPLRSNHFRAWLENDKSLRLPIDRVDSVAFLETYMEVLHVCGLFQVSPILTFHDGPQLWSLDIESAAEAEVFHCKEGTLSTTMERALEHLYRVGEKFLTEKGYGDGCELTAALREKFTSEETCRTRVQQVIADSHEVGSYYRTRVAPDYPMEHDPFWKKLQAFIIYFIHEIHLNSGLDDHEVYEIVHIEVQRAMHIYQKANPVKEDQ